MFFRFFEDFHEMKKDCETNWNGKITVVKEKKLQYELKLINYNFHLKSIFITITLIRAKQNLYMFIMKFSPYYKSTGIFQEKKSSFKNQIFKFNCIFLSISF